jgi:hypothetical protein
MYRCATITYTCIIRQYIRWIYRPPIYPLDPPSTSNRHPSMEPPGVPGAQPPRGEVGRVELGGDCIRAVHWQDPVGRAVNGTNHHRAAERQAAR